MLSDVVADMADIAQRRAEARGLRNTEAAMLDLEAIESPDASVDAALCREGLMLTVRPERALREVHRILRPGGRAAFAVWGPRAENPWLGLVLDAVTAETGLTVPPPGVPGPFSLDDGDRLDALLRDAGFADVVVERVSTPMVAESVEEWWTRTQDLAGPLAAIVAQLPDTTRTALAERLRRAAAPFATPTGVELPGVTLLASGQRR